LKTAVAVKSMVFCTYSAELILPLEEACVLLSANPGFNSRHAYNLCIQLRSLLLSLLSKRLCLFHHCSILKFLPCLKTSLYLLGLEQISKDRKMWEITTLKYKWRWHKLRLLFPWGQSSQFLCQNLFNIHSQEIIFHIQFAYKSSFEISSMYTWGKS
jgi:hypothetical protein